MKRCVCLLFVVAGLHLCAAGQGTVRGHVFCGDTQQPARLAHVVLQPLVDLQSPALSRPGTSDKREGLAHLQTVGLDGSFVIPAVPAGLYYVVAEQEGYVSPLTLFSRADLNHPTDAMLRRIARYMTPVSVTNQQSTQVEIRLVRGATISGNVHFEDGGPAVNVSMNLLQKDASGTWQTMRLELLGGRNSRFTDDAGNYRFVGLPEGSYLVRANLELNNIVTDHIFGNGGGTIYQDGYHLRIFSGDVFRPRDAKVLKVEEGETLAAADISIPLSKLFSLSGTVLRPDGAAPVNAARLTLLFADDQEDLTSTEVDSNDGNFHFDFVPAGVYQLQASRIGMVERTEVPTCEQCLPPTRTETKVVRSYGDASLPIELTGDETGIAVQAKPSTKP